MSDDYDIACLRATFEDWTRDWDAKHGPAEDEGE